MFVLLDIPECGDFTSSFSWMVFDSSKTSIAFVSGFEIEKKDFMVSYSGHFCDKLAR